MFLITMFLCLVAVILIAILFWQYWSIFSCPLDYNFETKSALIINLIPFVYPGIKAGIMIFEWVTDMRDQWKDLK